MVVLTLVCCTILVSNYGSLAVSREVAVTKEMITMLMEVPVV